MDKIIGRDSQFAKLKNYDTPSLEESAGHDA
jgi:hypothetical protein